MSPLRVAMEAIRISWNAFKDVTIYETLTIGHFVIGFFVLFCIAGFINMFMHRGE